MQNEDIYSSFTAKLWSPEATPKALYHYTTCEGTRSIISNGKALWASSFETMNDSQELKKGLNIAKYDLVPFLSQISIDDLTKLLTENWHKLLDEEIKKPLMRPYILCFTESSESKLHWEMYGDNFKGIALEFRHKFELSNSPKGFFIKVVYDEITARENLRINFNKATELFITDYSC